MNYKIITTPEDLINKGMWKKYCELINIDAWAINKGEINSVGPLELTLNEAIIIGLIKRERSI